MDFLHLVAVFDNGFAHGYQFLSVTIEKGRWIFDFQRPMRFARYLVVCLIHGSANLSRMGNCPVCIFAHVVLSFAPKTPKKTACLAGFCGCIFFINAFCNTTSVARQYNSSR
ncbi:MAG: hypothetical protein LBJ12_00200 [Oscillospiraceae bacterium]|nr:hypothetical protein [Oscillospiraceae bacterium]